MAKGGTTQPMRIVVNGSERDVPEGATVSQVMDLLKVRRDTVAVEVNREIIPRARHPEYTLHAGDALEIVTFVGGG